jgi:hypothetical protein
MMRGLPIRKRTAFGSVRPLSLRSTAPMSSLMNSINPIPLTLRCTRRWNSSCEAATLEVLPNSAMSGWPMAPSIEATTASNGLDEIIVRRSISTLRIAI